MTDYDENAELETTEVGGAPPEDNSNRNFLIVAGVLGGIMLLTLVCIAIFGAVYLPRAQSAQKTAAAEVNAQNTAVALSVQQTDQAAKMPPTSTATTPPTQTSVPTNTQVVKPATTSTATSVAAPFTATAEALSKTLAAQQSKTLPPTSTALPTSGFADEVGLPGLFALAGALLVIILIARRLRTA